MWNWNSFEYKIIIPLIAIIIIFLFNYLVPDSFYSWRKSSECRLERDMKNAEYSGVVEEKFLDTNNHNIKTIKLSNDFIEIYQNHNNFFEMVEVGDSIYKKNNSLRFDIFRQDSSFSIIIDFRCKS
jgi:lipopolysaccharide export LptBFGC system permease protein LptF